MDKYTGKRLDARYEIHELIGVGGMAVVYRAYDIIEDKIVAIKILKDEYLGNEEFIRRFKNESKAIAVLSHENIVQVYDVSFGTKIQYIVMEYIDGITLKGYISQQKVIKWKEAVYFTRQILCALKHAHSKGVVHRDIKPQNIMLLKDGTIKVTDFGIARVTRNETQTMMNRAIGSVHYIAPEQAKGGVTDEKVDIYSVGVIMYEMLTGKLPFEADNAVSVAIMQMQTKPKPLREINDSIPEGLEEITLHAMEKNPSYRYQTSDEMLEDIEKFQNNPSIRFEYKYFVDDNPTKYLDAINNARENDGYDDGYNYKDNKEESKKKATVITGGIAIAVAIFAVIFLFSVIFNSCGSSASKDVEVPYLVGMKLTDVQNNPEYKFVWKIESVYDATKAEGIIIDQEPAPDTKKIKEGSTIILKVNSSGVLVTVPNLKGLTEESAKAKLSNVGLKFETLMIVDNETAAGIVSDTNPQEGSKVTSNSTVRIYVSKGPEEEKVMVPDVIGKSLSAARNELADKGLKVADNIEYQDSDKAKDVVISTTPLPGVSVSIDAPISLIVSSGVKREKSIDVTVDLPKSVNEKIAVIVYVNGVQYKADVVNPSYDGNYTFTIKGNTGKKNINVELNNKLYRVYEINFDASSNNIEKKAEYEFISGTESSQKKEPSQSTTSDKKDNEKVNNSTTKNN